MGALKGFFDVSNPVTRAVVVYLAIIGFMLIKRPRSMFNLEIDPETGKEQLVTRKFGLGQDKTLFSFHIVSLIIAIVVFFTSVSVE